MKFRVASLLSLLSGIAFMNTSALGMDNLRDEGGPSSHVSSKRKKVLTPEQNNLEVLLREQHVVNSYVSIRKSGNQASKEELVEFLMGERWKAISPEDQSWVVERVTSEVRRLELDDLEKLISDNRLPNVYLSLRQSGNQASKEELVEFLMGERWKAISSEDQSWVVNRITSEAQRLELDVLLDQQDYSRAFRSIKSFGRHASDEGAVKFLLESNGYGNWDQLSDDTRTWVVAKVKSPTLATEGEEVTLTRAFTNAVLEYRENFRDFRTALQEYAIQQGVPQNQVFFDQFDVIPLVNTALTLGTPLLESLVDVRATELKFSSDSSASDSIEDVVRKCINATGLFNISHYTSFLERGFYGPLVKEFYGIQPRLKIIEQQECEAFEKSLKANGFIETVMRYTVAFTTLSEGSYLPSEYAAVKRELNYNYDVMLKAAEELEIATPRTESQIQESLYNEHPVFRPWYRMVKSVASFPELWKQMKDNAHLKKKGAGKA